MSRRDLTEAEIQDLRLWARNQAPGIRSTIERLVGEVLELREREAHSRSLHELEGEY